MRENECDRKFLKFVQKAREEQGFSMEQICEGIGSSTTLHFVENGNWKADKLVRDCILGRLGVDVTDYEQYLNYEEYGRFSARNRILQWIALDEAERAEELLKEYKAAHEKGSHKGNHIEEQFCLCMEAQILDRRGGHGKEVLALLEKAAALTIPEFGLRSLDQMVLSAHELNLILEAEARRVERERTGKYWQIVGYIEKKRMDRAARAKIYPKAVYFLCRGFLEESGRQTAADGKAGEAVPEELEGLLRYCEHAVELLRDSGRMYYLWELLEMEVRLAGLLAETDIRRGLQKRAGAVKEWSRMRDVWRQTLEAAYEEQGIPCREGMCFPYFYLETGCFYVNHVIKIRREMLGMSRQELCDGICDVKTLTRLEKHNMRTQQAIAEKLLERLGLPADYTRTDLITDSAEARELMREVRRCVDCRSIGRSIDQAPVLLKQVKELIPMGIRYNRQAIERHEALCSWEKKELGREEYYRRVREALELTLPYDAFLKEGEKYLTHMEQACIQSLMETMGEDSREYLLCTRRFEEMYRPFEEKGQVAAMATMYEFIMYNVSSDLGNRGEYDRSDRYSDIILRNCLAYRRSEVIKSCFYNRWWNYDKRRSEGIPDGRRLDDRAELERCIVFAEIVKDMKRMKFYQRKLERLEAER